MTGGSTDWESGRLGFFWLPNQWPPDLDQDPERGWIRVESRFATIDVLDEDPIGSFDHDLVQPEAMAAALPTDSLLLLETYQSRASRRFGGLPRASSKQYRARTVVGNAPVGELRSPKLLAASANFHGIGRWAGLSASEERSKMDQGVVKEWTLKLSESEELSATLSGGRLLEVSTSWRVDGPPDRRTISAPTVIGCKTTRPRDAWMLLEPLVHIQNLLSIAFGGLVVAEGGSAAVDLGAASDSRRGTPTFWSGPLHAPPKSAVLPKNMKEHPLFRLSTVGGIEGLGRWVRLCDKHGRAVRPLVRHFRTGHSAAEVTLIETAAAMEYWVKANRTSRWAQTRRWAQAIAGRAGKAFAEWAGDPEAWGKAFWGTNNALKHEPTATMDPRELTDLAVSGRHLLTAILLDRVAGSRAPSRTIFRHHRLHDLGLRMRERFG